MSRQREKIKCVALEFYDHCEDYPRPLKCRVFGEIIEETKDYYLIASWELAEQDGINEASRVHNRKSFVILKPVVTKKLVFSF